VLEKVTLLKVNPVPVICEPPVVKNIFEVPALNVRFVAPAKESADVVEVVTVLLPKFIVLVELPVDNIPITVTEKLLVVNVPAVKVKKLVTLKASARVTVPLGALTVKELNVLPAEVNVAVAKILTEPVCV
jgi:hypothetical protein